MSTEYDDCLKKKKIKKYTRGRSLAAKELQVAEGDLASARRSLEDKNYKWATIQVYYSMFHSARALLYNKNFREHSHYCLIEAMRELYVKSGDMPVTLVEGLKEAKNLREDADYFNQWSAAGCKRLMKIAEKWIELAGSIIN